MGEPVPVGASGGFPMASFPTANRIGNLITVKWKDSSMVTTVSTLLMFVIALVISTIVIYVITKLFGETESITTALIAAIAGTVIYTIVYYLIGNGLIAAIIGGIVWLLALQHLYKIGWVKSLLIAIVVWVVASIVGWFLPTLLGPI
jgi:Na+/melibiose symporter-like transporter